MARWRAGHPWLVGVLAALGCLVLGGGLGVLLAWTWLLGVR